MLQRGAGLIGGLCYRPRPDKIVEIARLKTVGVGGEGAEVRDAIAAGTRPECGCETKSRQGREPPRAAPFDCDALGAGQAAAHQRLSGGGAVGHIHHTPLAVEAFAIGAAKACGAAVVHIHHPPAAGGPELNAQAEPCAGHARGTAMPFHQ